MLLLLQVNFQTKVYHPVGARGTPVPVQVVLHAAVLRCRPQPLRVARPSGCLCLLPNMWGSARAEYQQQWQHLLGYLERAVEPGTDRIKGAFAPMNLRGTLLCLSRQLTHNMPMMSRGT